MDKRTILFKKCSENIVSFAKLVCGSAVKDDIPDFHREIYDFCLSENRLALAAPRGFAKAQSVDSKVLTPSGWKLMGELKDGDLVIGSDGKPTRVTVAHPIQEMDLYCFVTRDGRSTLCNGEHLWKVTIPSNTKTKTIVKKTSEIAKNYRSDRVDKRTGRKNVEFRYFIDTVDPIDFPKKDLLVDPYTLGCWLGDGTSDNGGFTTEDEEILGYFPYEVSRQKAKMRFTILGIMPKLRKLGVLCNKHIPKEYLTSSIEQRVALLQGLVDTDGYIVNGGRNFGFCNKNETVMDGFCDLVRSLGGTITISEQWTRFNKESEYKKSFRASCRVPSGIVPVRLKRKSSLWRGSIKTKTAIIRVEKVTSGLGRCITVENKDGLYVTDDYLLTHNSTIISKIYPLWCVIFKKYKDICIISASESLATEHLRWIKQELEYNEIIKDWAGDLKSEKWTETHIIAQHKDGTRINIRAKGSGGQLRGFRPDCIILDDIESDEGVESEDQRKKLKNWLFKACFNCLLPGGQLLVIGTVIHPLSVLSDLLDTPNGWKKKKYQAYIDGIEDGEHVLWSSRPHEWLQQRKSEIGSSAFASEYMNDPKSDESAPIQEKHLRYWEELPKQLSLCIAVDPAYSEEDKSDYKVAVLVGIDQNHNRYLVDYVRTHDPSGEFMDAVLNMFVRNQGTITGLGVPNSGTEKEFYKSFLNKAMDRKLSPPFVELKNTFTTVTGTSIRNKKKRITAALQPLFEQGKYYIHSNHFEAREELLTIGSSRWDDLVDAMTYAEQLVTPIYYEVTETPQQERSMAGACEGYGIEY